MNRLVHQGDRVALFAPRLYFTICERAWPSALVKLPTATSWVFAGLLDICSTSVTSPAYVVVAVLARRARR